MDCVDCKYKCEEYKNSIVSDKAYYEWGLKLDRCITKDAAREFYRDLCGTVYGNADINSQGIMSAALIADHMKMSIEKANEFLDACCRYGITERQGGGWVV